MKLYINQKVEPWKDKFYIKDENEQDVYSVEGEVFSMGKKLHIYDMNGGEIANVHLSTIGIQSKLYVFINTIKVAEIIKEFVFFKPKYTITGPGWTAEGNIISHDYEICADRRTTIANVHKVRRTWGDCFEVSILNDDDIPLALSTALAIDVVMDSQGN